MIARDDPTALLGALQRELLARALRDEVDGGGLVVLARDEDDWSWEPVADPDADDHRLAHLSREAGDAVRLAGPLQAAGAIAIVRDAPDPHATLYAWAAHRDGERSSVSVLALPTADGVVVPGPPRPMHPLGVAVHDALAGALSAGG